MEDDVFPLPAVAGAINSNFIEARIHVDIKSYLTEQQLENNKAIRDEIVPTRAMPTFAVVDPATGRVLGWTGLEGSLAEWEGFFLEFLETSRRKADPEAG